MVVVPISELNTPAIDLMSLFDGDSHVVLDCPTGALQETILGRVLATEARELSADA